MDQNILHRDFADLQTRSQFHVQILHALRGRALLQDERFALLALELELVGRVVAELALGEPPGDSELGDFLFSELVSALPSQEAGVDLPGDVALLLVDQEVVAGEDNVDSGQQKRDQE